MWKKSIITITWTFLKCRDHFFYWEWLAILLKPASIVNDTLQHTKIACTKSIRTKLIVLNFFLHANIKKYVGYNQSFNVLFKNQFNVSSAKWLFIICYQCAFSCVSITWHSFNAMQEFDQYICSLPMFLPTKAPLSFNFF